MTTNLLADTEEGTKAENQPKKVSSKQLFFWRYLDQAKKNVYLLVVIEALGKGGTGLPFFLVSWFQQLSYLGFLSNSNFHKVHTL